MHQTHNIHLQGKTASFLIVLIGFIVVLSFICGFGFSLYIKEFNRFSSYQKPPIYPNSNNVIVNNPRPNVEIYTFQTLDSQEKIMEFYRNFSVQHQWEFRRWTENGLGFVFITSGPIYGFDITVEDVGSGVNQVQLHYEFSNYKF